MNKRYLIANKSPYLEHRFPQLLMCEDALIISGVVANKNMPHFLMSWRGLLTEVKATG